ncbi:hypothetical protein ACHAXH_000438, partial [Discostella pseudostelligera]
TNEPTTATPSFAPTNEPTTATPSFAPTNEPTTATPLVLWSLPGSFSFDNSTQNVLASSREFSVSSFTVQEISSLTEQEIRVLENSISYIASLGLQPNQSVQSIKLVNSTTDSAGRVSIEYNIVIEEKCSDAFCSDQTNVTAFVDAYNTNFQDKVNDGNFTKSVEENLSNPQICCIGCCNIPTKTSFDFPTIQAEAVQVTLVTLSPTSAPTNEPTTATPSFAPTNEPTTETPSITPTNRPTASPSKRPTATPTNNPTTAPSNRPTAAPSKRPTSTPTNRPTALPSKRPIATPTKRPKPTAKPTSKITPKPTTKPTAKPTSKITPKPTTKPTAKNTAKPTKKKLK